MKDTFETAIGEINSYSLYTAPPYEDSADVRQYIESTVTDTAESACTEAWDRINAGEAYDDVTAEYTGDEAFEKWYTDFENGLSAITGD